MVVEDVFTGKISRQIGEGRGVRWGIFLTSDGLTSLVCMPALRPLAAVPVHLTIYIAGGRGVVEGGREVSWREVEGCGGREVTCYPHDQPTTCWAAP